MFYQKNHVLVGLLIGIVMPIIAYALLLTLLETVDTYKTGYEQIQFATAFQPRTLALISLFINPLFMRYYKKLRAEESMRGVMVAVGILAIAWLIKFYPDLPLFK